MGEKNALAELIYLEAKARIDANGVSPCDAWLIMQAVCSRFSESAARSLLMSMVRFSEDEDREKEEMLKEMSEGLEGEP